MVKQTNNTESIINFKQIQFIFWRIKLIFPDKKPNEMSLVSYIGFIEKLTYPLQSFVLVFSVYIICFIFSLVVSFRFCLQTDHAIQKCTINII